MRLLVALIMVAALVMMGLSQILWAGTPGKRFGHLRVIQARGGPLKRWEMTGRFFFQLLPFHFTTIIQLLDALNLEPWFFGSDPQSFNGQVFLGTLIFIAIDFLWIFTNKDRRALHDYIFRSRVLDRGVQACP